MSVTIIIIAVTVLFSFKGFQDQSFFYKFDFSPYQVKHRKEWYRFITHAFLHADWTHLFFNMFVLYEFGSTTHEVLKLYSGEGLGTFYFILLYFGGIGFATLTTYRKYQDDVNYHSIGASGAVSAVLFSYIIFMPMAELRLLIFPFFGLPSVVWGIVYLAYEHFQSKRNSDHINHDAHLTGALFGIIFTVLTNPSAIVNFINQVFEYFS